MFFTYREIMDKQKSSDATVSVKKDEKILVLRREKLFPGGAPQGLIPATNFEYYQKLIQKNQEFLWRSDMEEDIAYKQIIPYLVFCYDDTYFLMRRRSNASEARLKDKYSLGIGGHIRQEDMAESSLMAWAAREFGEEVNFDGSFVFKPLGILNDDSNAVGQVHTGFVFLLEGNSPHISIKSELKEGNLLTLEEMKPLYDKMEGWTQLVFDHLVTNPSIHFATQNTQDERCAGSVCVEEVSSEGQDTSAHPECPTQTGVSKEQEREDDEPIKDPS